MTDELPGAAAGTPVEPAPELAVGRCAVGCGTRVAWRRATGVGLGELPCPRCGRRLVRTARIGRAPWLLLADDDARGLARPAARAALRRAEARVAAASAAAGAGDPGGQDALRAADRHAVGLRRRLAWAEDDGD